MSTKPIDFIEKIINAHVCAMNREKASCVLAYVKSEVYSHLLIMVLLLLLLDTTNVIDFCLKRKYKELLWVLTEKSKLQ